MPGLLDSRHRVTIGEPRTNAERALAAAGATLILHDRGGGLAGVYVDNETPRRDVVAGELRDRLGAGYRVVVGLGPSEPSVRIPGCVCAFEWYPFHGGWGMPTRSNLALASGPMPEAWILQWSFAWPGDRLPTGPEKYRLLAFVKARHPRAKLVWLY